MRLKKKSLENIKGLDMKMSFHQEINSTEEHSLWDRLFNILGIFEVGEYIQSGITRTNFVTGGGAGVNSVVAHLTPPAVIATTYEKRTS